MFERVIACTLLILTSAAAAARAQALTFTRLDRSTDPGARAIVAADFDGDGVIDLATASGTRNTVAILINARNAGGSFGVLHKYTVAAGPFAMAVADFNGDGSPDIVVAAADADRINVLLNHGDGTFVVSEVSAPGSPRGIAAGDIDHDGHVDLIYTSYSVDTVAVLFGDGTGQFHSTAVSATGHNPEQVAVADLDGDGELDLVVANSGISPLSVFYGNGTGGFRRVDLAGPKQLFAVTIGDFDGDGRPDVAAVSQASKSVAVYFNKITGLAYSMSLAVPASNARGIVAADFNKDGLADLAVAYRGRRGFWRRPRRLSVVNRLADGWLVRRPTEDCGRQRGRGARRRRHRLEPAGRLPGESNRFRASEVQPPRRRFDPGVGGSQRRRAPRFPDEHRMVRRRAG